MNLSPISLAIREAFGRLSRPTPGTDGLLYLYAFAAIDAKQN